MTKLNPYSAVSSKKLLYLRFFRKTWRLIKHGQLDRLWHIAIKYATSVPRREKNLALALERLFISTGTENALLVIDQDLGGGANLYRERMLSSLLEHGESVLILNFFMPTLQFVLEYRHGKNRSRFSLASVEEIILLAKAGFIREVFYNNAVSFHDPIQIPDLLTRLRETSGLPIRIALHDYFPICPSFFLLNDHGEYCDLPSAEECMRCLGKNKEGFVQEAGVTDIVRWRNNWERCLRLAEEVICFSDASRKILQRAYPGLNPGKIVLRPHTVDYLPARSAPAINLERSLHIGVVGNITKAKGAMIIRDLADEIRRRRLEIPITVIGTVDAEYHIAHIKESGRYTPDKLSELIESSGANLFLFPSIVPETFSYVVSELIALKVPVACFDLGAQAERVKEYALGHVISYNGPNALLDALQSFHTRLKRYPTAATGE